MFMQDPVLGLAAVALYPVQGYIIPKLQDKVNQLGRAPGADGAPGCRPCPRIGEPESSIFSPTTLPSFN